ncbi:MAG: permease [Demequinaceae bacterium]|nr:permease [Demequinaceae bacterium]
MPTPLPTPTLRQPTPTGVTAARLVLLGVTWAIVFAFNEWVWDAAVSGMSLDPHSRATEAAHYFLYDSAKLLLLLVGMIFAIGLLRSTINPERVRAALEGRPLLLALVLAAILGAVTPFCSCSSIPLFIGFVAAGIPLGVTLTFLIASPLVNEVAVVVLGDTFGWGVTGAYVAAGLILAILAGLLLSRFDLRDQVEAFVFATPISKLHLDGAKPTLADRVKAARIEVRDIVGRVWVWVLIGVGIGAVIHGWVPEAFFVEHAGADNPAAVPIATIVGIPLYSNAAAAIPIGEALYAKGVALGTVFSFMMATVALSLPEAVMLRRVLKPRLLVIFFGIVGVGIMTIGYIFNWVS